MPTLHWIGKEKVINHHLDVPFRTLEKQYTYLPLSPGREQEFSSEKEDGNMIIHGDNLEALKALLPRYEGRVKCIYIDPPYNTGNEGWVYNDNVNDPKIKRWLHDVVGKEGEDLSRHDKWLCMMYPRLKLLSKLLHEDGCLLISISYHEVFNLVQICKEIFGTKQIVSITIQTSGGKPSSGFNYLHEYLIFIVPANIEPNSMLHVGGNSRSPFEGLTLATFNKVQRPNQTYPIYVNESDGSLFGVGESLTERLKNGSFKETPDKFTYDFSEAPKGTVAIWPITSKGDDCVWRLIPSRLLNDWQKGYIKISPNRSKESKNKYSIQYLPEGVIRKIEKGILEVKGTEPGVPTLLFGDNKTVGSEIPTIWTDKSFYTVKGTTLISDIFDSKIFSYPKPVDFVCEALRAVSSENDIILDSFAGSGTTAHAVLNLNKQDGGNRKFILVEMEEYAESITAERVKRVMMQEPLTPKGEPEAPKQEMSFSFYELGQPLFNEDGHLNEAVGVGKIREYVWYTETSCPSPAEGLGETSFLGIHNDTAYYFHYEVDALTTLNHEFLAGIAVQAAQYVIYADNCLLTRQFMTRHHIIFKKIPRDIRRF